MSVKFYSSDNSYALKNLSQRVEFARTTSYSFNITPAINGKTTWNLETDGNLTLNTNGYYSISTFADRTVFEVRMWGGGGGTGGQGGTGGAGGATTGVLQVDGIGANLQLVVGQGGRQGGGGVSLGGGGSSDGLRGGGAGYSGIFLAGNINLITQNNAVMMAGGGGGAGGPSGNFAGAGGGPSGGSGQNSPSPAYAQGGTQIAGGIGGAGNGVALRGGNGLSGGGGGFFGGAGGSDNGSYAPGGGGGSGFINVIYSANNVTIAVIDGTTTAGASSTVALATNPARGNAGNIHSPLLSPGSIGYDGRIFIKKPDNL